MAKFFSEKTVLEEKISLEDISNKYELSGGAIINVTRFSSLMAVKRDSNTILFLDLIEGIRREYRKDGKVIGKDS